MSVAEIRGQGQTEGQTHILEAGLLPAFKLFTTVDLMMTIRFSDEKVKSIFITNTTFLPH